MKLINLRIFISSVQKEFAEERRLLKRYISKNPAYRRFFDTFVFEEDVVVADRRTDEVYLDELGKCDVYIEHSSYPNNNFISDQLYQVKYIEKFGTGFTDLVDGCRSVGLSDPVVDDAHSGFALTIWRRSANSEVEKTNKKTIENVAVGKVGQVRLTGSSKVVLSAILKAPEMSIAKSSQTTKLSVEGVKYQIAKLKSLVGLVHVGPNKGGHWEMRGWRPSL